MEYFSIQATNTVNINRKRKARGSPLREGDRGSDTFWVPFFEHFSGDLGCVFQIFLSALDPIFRFYPF